MIDCLIFSKDRPAQLDLLLRSIQLHAPGLYRRVQISWLATDSFYRAGYKICEAEHGDGLARAFVDERFCIDHAAGTSFENWVRVWLAHPNRSQTVSFLVDDDVFYRDAQEPDVLPWSYRGGDYDYPFSLDGNVYAKTDIEKLLHGLRFTDPTELEHQGHLHRDRLPFTEVAHGEPCLVGVPANRVSKSSGMPHMGQHEYDLNEKYLAGERLALFGQQVAGPAMPAHANIELVFA